MAIERAILLAILNAVENRQQPYNVIGGSVTTERNVGNHIAWLGARGYARTVPSGEDDNGDDIVSITTSGQEFHRQLKAEKARGRF